MNITRLNRRLTAWIASFAILLGALAPTISHALVRAGGEGTRWVEVCTISGLKLVAIDADRGAGRGAGIGADEDGQGGSGLLATEPCPYCATHADNFGLPPALGMSLARVRIPDSLPPLYYHAPRPLYAWAAAHARAPPLPA